MNQKLFALQIDIHGKRFDVKYLTMTDEKVCSTLTNTESTSICVVVSSETVQKSWNELLYLLIRRKEKQPEDFSQIHSYSRYHRNRWRINSKIRCFTANISFYCIYKRSKIWRVYLGNYRFVYRKIQLLNN